MDIRSLTLAEYRDALVNKAFSAEEGVREFLSAIQKEDTDIHSYISVFEERAISQAKEIDTAGFGENLPGVMQGIPLAVKDNILIHGEKTTAGSKILEQYTASYDATVITKLRDAGAIFLGKTNLDEFAMGASTETSAFGVTRNPHDVTRVPGGSSGGSAAAIAADLAVASLGSDTGGSVRQPSAFCGVVGFKPSYGAVSRFGLIAMTSSLDQIGPIAKTVEDAEIIFDCIQGRDRHDATSIGVGEDAPKEKEIKKMRIGIAKEYFGAGVADDVKRAVYGVIEKFRADGFEISEVTVPHLEYSIATYYIIVPAEVSANLARFDGIRYPQILSGINGGEAGIRDLFEKYARARGYGFGDEVKRRILLGTFVLSAGHYDAYYRKAEQVREIITREFESVFNSVDLLLAPTTPNTAFTIGEKVDDPLTMYREDILTSPANLAGLPALSVPIKKYKRGSGELPIGFQIIGKRYTDKNVLALGKYYEKHLR